MLAFWAGLLLPRFMVAKGLVPLAEGGGTSPLLWLLPLACRRLLFLREKRPMVEGLGRGVGGWGVLLRLAVRARACDVSPVPFPCDSRVGGQTRVTQRWRPAGCVGLRRRLVGGG